MIYIIFSMVVVFAVGYYTGTGHHKTDLAELERWQLGQIEASQWLAEFPDAADAIDTVRLIACGDLAYGSVQQVRDKMRLRRDAAK